MVKERYTEYCLMTIQWTYILEAITNIKEKYNLAA
jgi:hypothetical protein